MGRIAKFLTDYVIAKGTVKEDERGMYEYGFLITLEKILCLDANIPESDDFTQKSKFLASFRNMKNSC